MNDLEDALKGMSEPEVPSGLAAIINARIARVDAERSGAASWKESSSSEPAAERVSTSFWHQRLAWTPVAAGLIVGVAAQAYRLAAGETAMNLLAPRITGGGGAALQMLPASPSAAALALGLALFLAGLLTAQREGARHRRPVSSRTS